MKKCLAALSLFAMFLVSCGQSAAPEASNLDGYFATKRIADSFLLYNQQPSYESIYFYILDANPDYNDSVYPAHYLADTIQVVSSDMGIDAYVLTALIHKESTFRREAVSPTNAAGFTQMTNVGISEVHDQLGARGPQNARADTTAYFRSTAVPTYERLTGVEWVDLWNVSNPKTVLKADGDMSVVYGAILLKTLLAVAKQGNPNGTMLDWYIKALEGYNGDTNRVAYRKKILEWATAWSANPS